LLARDFPAGSLILRHVLPAEWAALFLLVLSGGAVWALSVAPFFVLPVMLIWAAVAIGSIAGGIIAALRDSLSVPERIRSFLAAPVVTALALFFGVVVVTARI
jgi:hypothetical protein